MPLSGGTIGVYVSRLPRDGFLKTHDVALVSLLVSPMKGCARLGAPKEDTMSTKHDSSRGHRLNDCKNFLHSVIGFHDDNSRDLWS